jgi:pyruvate/2-oxoglutarate dehydrogenase complex dihydrolipoamide dehydrogenase (E3) component
MADMAEISRPELCIVGAGALGIALAQHARHLGASVMLVDRGFDEPGDGPQRAIRLAALAASAAAAAQVRGAARLGVGSVDSKVTMKSVQERARQVAAERAPVDSVERLAALGIEVVRGSTRFTDATTLAVGERQIRPQSIVLAVGGNPIVPTIPGLGEAGYFTAETILDNARKLTHLLVVGAAAEAVAMAQIYARFGSQVTLVPQGWALAGFDMETASILKQALAEDGVRILDGASVRTVKPRSQGIGAEVEFGEGRSEMLDLSHILVAGDLLPSLEELDLEAARLRPVRGQPGRYASGALGQTSNGRVRVTGFAAGIDQWQHALAHGRSVIDALVLGAPRHHPGAMPRLVLTEPALAQIGRLPEVPGRLSPGHALYRVNLAENDLVRARSGAAGLIKVVANPKGRIVGASIVGDGAAELAGVLALAMDQGLALEALAELPLPHPSLMNSLVSLAENRSASRAVSNFARRRGALKRLLRF